MGIKSEEKIEAIFEQMVLDIVKIGSCQYGKPVFIVPLYGNLMALRPGARILRKLFYKIAGNLGFRLSRRQIEAIEDMLCDMAYASDDIIHVSLRVANLDDGSIEIYLSDDERQIVRLKDGEVEIIKEGAQAIFEEPLTMRPLPIPEGTGDYTLFIKYINMVEVSRMILIAWVTYTMSLAKVPSSNYVLLAVTGSMGSGKTSLIKMILDLIDPSTIGTQLFPRNQKDLVTIARNLHLACFDNARYIDKSQSDFLSVCCTGGSSSTRELYTNAGVHTSYLHLGVIINSIQPAVTEQDLIDRSLPLEMQPIKDSDRKSEKELAAQFQEERPEIYMGLLQLTAKIRAALPTVTVTSSERMIDFVQWLAGMESVVENSGALQGYYSMLLSESQLDTLIDNNPLFAAVIELSEKNRDESWEGSSTQLLEKLGWEASNAAQRAHDWPKSPSSLSKKLIALTPALMKHDIDVQITRGKQRKITITHKDTY